MRYALLPLIDEAGWLKLTKAEQELGIAAYGVFVEALTKAGVLVGNYRPQPSSAAKTVRITNGETQVLDGPYADTKEQLGGIYIIEVPNLDAALSWAARCPAAGYGVVEVRPLLEPTSLSLCMHRICGIRASRRAPICVRPHMTDVECRCRGDRRTALAAFRGAAAELLRYRSGRAIAAGRPLGLAHEHFGAPDHSGQAEFWMVSTKSGGFRSGTKWARRSALTVPQVVAGRSFTPSVNALRIWRLKSGRG